MTPEKSQRILEYRLLFVEAVPWITSVLWKAPQK
jgi:hypothetical protein